MLCSPILQHPNDSIEHRHEALQVWDKEHSDATGSDRVSRCSLFHDCWKEVQPWSSPRDGDGNQVSLLRGLLV